MGTIFVAASSSEGSSCLEISFSFRVSEKKRRRCAVVVPSLTSDQVCRMWFRIRDRIQVVA